MTETTNLAELHRKLAAEPGAIIETIAKDFGVTLREAVEALPVPMHRFAPGTAFVDIMKEVARWGEVTVIVHSEDGIMEFTGPVPEGSIACGYYNLPGHTGFHGHLRYERCADIAFVERPLFGRRSASILFFNCGAGIMFKIFVGRDAQRALRSDQLAAFRVIADRLCSESRRAAE